MNANFDRDEVKAIAILAGLKSMDRGTAPEIAGKINLHGGMRLNSVDVSHVLNLAETYGLVSIIGWANDKNTIYQWKEY